MSYVPVMPPPYRLSKHLLRFRCVFNSFLGFRSGRPHLRLEALTLSHSSGTSLQEHYSETLPEIQNPDRAPHTVIRARQTTTLKVHHRKFMISKVHDPLMVYPNPKGVLRLFAFYFFGTTDYFEKDLLLLPTT